MKKENKRPKRSSISVFYPSKNKEVEVFDGEFVIKTRLYRTGVTSVSAKYDYERAFKALGNKWGPFTIYVIRSKELVELQHKHSGKIVSIHPKEIMVHEKLKLP